VDVSYGGGLVPGDDHTFTTWAADF
jgi:hypothetical protein